MSTDRPTTDQPDTTDEGTRLATLTPRNCADLRIDHPDLHDATLAWLRNHLDPTKLAPTRHSDDLLRRIQSATLGEGFLDLIVYDLDRYGYFYSFNGEPATHHRRIPSHYPPPPDLLTWLLRSPTPAAWEPT